MLKTTLRSFWEHKRRLVSTLLSVVLGVAFMAGTFVFTDTLNKSFDDLFASIYDDVDALVEGEELFDADFGGSNARLDQGIVDTVAGVDGVVEAQPYVFAGQSGRVLGADGEDVGSNQGPPSILESWIPEGPLSTYELVDGGEPTTDTEVALNVAAADDGDYEVGDEVTVLTAEGRLTYTLVGTFTIGGSDSAGGTVLADFTLAEAQRLAGLDGQINQVFVAGDEGLTQDELVSRIQPALPEGAAVKSGEQAAEDDAGDIQEGLGFFSQILTVFAAIALLVGTFIIYNTFSILVAQRSRELALLRAIGASRGQVLRSVVVEALIVGAITSVVGLAAGIALAGGVQGALSGAGLDLPTTSLVIAPATIATSFVIGMVVTLLAAIFPAIRATRVPPIAALRDVAIDRSGASRGRLVLGVVGLAGSGFLLSQGFTAEDTDGIVPVGAGAALLLLSLIVVGPVIATPLARGIGVLLPRLKGVTGNLARENASRSPKRTASTALALTVGVALVTFINVFASSATESINGELDRGLRADLIIGQSGFVQGGFSPALAAELAESPDVALVSSIRFGIGQVTPEGGAGEVTFIGAIDPTSLGDVLESQMAEGAITDLAAGGAIVDRQLAAAEGVAVGDTVTVLGPAGAEAPLTIQAISDDPALLGGWTITQEDYGTLFPEPADQLVFVNLAEGLGTEAGKEALEPIVEQYPGTQLQDQEEFAGSLAAQITSFVNVIYGLLALSIVIALIGIANTLSLSIYERTRELGLLRAVGMTRSQLRSAVRWEAVIIALLGTALGLLLGIGVAWPLLSALESSGLSSFVVPVGVLVTVVVVAAVLGTLASVNPARRAGKLNVLKAISTE